MDNPDKLILIGRVAGAHGVRGEVRITCYGDDPALLLKYRDLKREDGGPALTLTSGRVAKGALVARALQLADKTAADALKGLNLYVPRSALPPPEDDEYYLTDLIGLEARGPEGESLGKVINVDDFGAGDILEVKPASGATWFIAFTQDNVPSVQISEGWLEIHRPSEIEVQIEPDRAEQNHNTSSGT